MAELYYNEKLGEWAFRQKLRSPYIDYFHGWFFVTFQIARNKSALGAIVGDECVLNELGEAVRNAWQSHPAHAPGLEIFDFQVMPNHFHALVYYHCPGRGGPGTTRPPSTHLATALSSPLATAPGGLATAPRPIISTFTSHYERQLLERCLRSGRRFIWVCPGGIGPAVRTKAAAALAENRALLLSPVAPDTGVNKQRAIWCNQFVVKNAKEIWLGHIRPGGSLESILKATPGQFPTNLP